MTNIRLHRENENKVHEMLYDNLFLLSQFYPTSKDFNAIFKKDMFVKNNKAAFFEVVYYLLNVLNPVLTKEKLTVWPPYDIKRENKFRTEVLKYINELNVMYDNADIPHIMASHLISPGGMKFTKFMLKLSQLVMYEHLKKSQEEDILRCPKPSRNTSFNKINLNNLKKKISLIQQETRDVIRNFQSFHFESNEKALSIDDELKKLNNKIRSAKKENEVVKEEFNVNHPNYPPSAILEEKMSSIKCQYQKLNEILELLKECEDLISYLNSSEMVLEYNKEEMKLPNDVLHIENDKEELDLIKFFQSLNVLLEKNALEFPYPMDSFLKDNAKKIEELCTKHRQVNSNLSQHIKQLQSLLEGMEQFKTLSEPSNADETEVLAVPLTDSVIKLK